ncbi:MULTISPECIES: hypothetical protein [unclassified Nocardiopsis]|uniref:hypothetical protein n=1 Tax=Nocardiopsis TaxID=2013 RepID=UPI00387B4907
MADSDLTVFPDEMERAGRQLREPGQLVREAFSRLVAERQAMGVIWEPGEDIGDSLNENLPPMVKLLDQFGEALAVAFDRTADGVMLSARNYQNAEDHAVEVSDGLFDDGPGGLPGAGGGRR